MKSTKRVDRIALLAMVILLGLFFYTAERKSRLDGEATLTLLVLQATAGGAMAGTLLGRLSIDGKLLGFAVKAGGAIAFAILIFAAGLNYVSAKGALPPGSLSPTIERFTGPITIRYGDMDIAGDAAAIANPQLRDIEGSIKIDYGDIRLLPKKEHRNGRAVDAGTERRTPL